MHGLVARLIADLHHYSIPVGGDDVDICLCFSALPQAAFVKIWTSHVHNLPCHVKLQGGAGVRCVRFSSAVRTAFHSFSTRKSLPLQRSSICVYDGIYQ